jgi:CHAT domain-containing protein
MPAGNRNGFVFAITKTSISWAEIPLPPDKLRQQILSLHRQLEEGGATDAPSDKVTDPGFDRAAAFTLYRALLGNPAIQATIKGKERWLLAPQGSLISLPFSALVMEEPPGGVNGNSDPSYLRATKWLGLTKTLTLIPSVSTLRIQRVFAQDRLNNDSSPFFGLGDPAFTGRADVGPCSVGARSEARLTSRTYFRSGVVDIGALQSLPCLAKSGPEIRNLATNLHAEPNSYVLQLQATEAEVRRRNSDGRLKRAEVVAFATHGLIAGDLDGSLAEPALALTPPVLMPGQASSSDNDGLLTASEVATFELSARFVILSACNTAAGADGNSEG